MKFRQQRILKLWGHYKVTENLGGTRKRFWNEALDTSRMGLRPTNVFHLVKGGAEGAFNNGPTHGLEGF